MNDPDDLEDDDESRDENTDEVSIVSSVNSLSGITREIKNLSILSPTSSICTLHECNLPKTPFMLQCKKCKLLTHYCCTRLPAYQISLFLQKKYSLYICRSCIGKIDEELIEQCTTSERTEEEIRSLEEKLESTKHHLEYSLDQQTKFKSDNRLLVEKVKNLEEHQEVLRKNIIEQEKIMKLKNNAHKIPNIASKSIQVEQDIIRNKTSQDVDEYSIFIDDTNITKQRDKAEANVINQLELTINKKITDFSTSILDTISEVI